MDDKKKDQDSFKKCFGELRSLALNLNDKQPRGVREEEAIVGEGSDANRGVDGRRHSLVCLGNGQHMFSLGQVRGPEWKEEDWGSVRREDPPGGSAGVLPCPRRFPCCKS